MTASTETGVLILKTDATQVTAGAKSLDGLTDSAKNAEAMVAALTKAFSPVASAIDRLTAAVDLGVKSFSGMATAMNESNDATKKVTASTNDATAATKKLQETQDQQTSRIKAMVQASLQQVDADKNIAASGAKVALTDEQKDVAAASYLKTVSAQNSVMSASSAAIKSQAAASTSSVASTAAAEQATKKASAAVEGFTLNSSLARRELGRLGTDLAVGNYGRLSQTSLTLANYTGLMSKAFTGAGLAITGTLGILGLFTAAAIEGYLAEQKLNTSLIATGNYAGTTTDELQDMAKSLASGTATIGQTTAAVGALASSGKFTQDKIGLLAQATVNGGQLMGKSVDQMVSDFEKLEDSPVSASEALTAQYHYLTTATLQQIDALQKQGDASDAANLALKSYADALNQRAKEAEGQLGALQRAWDSVKSSASFAWDAMLGVGRPTTAIGQISQQYDDLLKKIDAVSTVAQGKKPGFFADQNLPSNIAQGAGGNFGFLSSAPTDDAISQAKAQLPLLLQQARDLQAKMATVQSTETAKAAADGVSKQVQQEGNDAVATLDKLGISLDGVKTKTDKVAEAAKALYAIHLAGGKLPAGVDFNGPTADTPEGSGWDKIKSQLLYGNKKKAPDPFANLNNLVQSAQVQDAGDGGTQATTLNKQAAAILKIVDAGAKLIASGHDVATVQAKVATGVEAVNDRFAKQADQLKQKNIVAIQQYQASLDNQNAALQRTIDSQVAKVGEGDKEYQQQQQINDLYVQGAQALTQLQLKRDAVAAKGGDTSVLDQNIAALKSNTDKQVAIVTNGYAQMDAAQSSWENGAIQAMQNWADQGANIAGQTATVFTDAFGSMSDALATFATTGKLDFKGFVASVLTDLAKMELRVAESKILEQILGMFVSTTGTTATANAGIASNISSLDASANSSFSLNAKGGVYNSPSLSAYSGQIVSKPTPFKFAAGAGIMGEAGPEAIMPLTRGSDGKLGVKSSGGNGGGVVINQSFNIDNSGNAASDTSTSGSNSDAARQLSDRMKAVANQEIQNQMRPGGILWKQANS